MKVTDPDGAADARERLAAWMIEHGFATGHGDTLDDLLGELGGQIEELRARHIISPDPKIAEAAGLDQAIIAELEASYASGFDAQLVSAADLKASLGAFYETLHGGPVMAYLDSLREEAQDAILELPNISPHDPSVIAGAQAAIRRYRHLIDWLQGVIAVPKPDFFGESPDAELADEDIGD